MSHKGGKQTPAAATPAPTPPPKEATKKKQLNKLYGINISFARVRRHLDSLNLNSSIDAELAKLKADIAKHKEGGDLQGVAPLSDLEAKVAAVSRERVRFSNDAAVALAVVCDRITTQLISHAMVTANSNDKRIIHLSHLHSPGIEKLSLYSLFATLPSFAESARKFREAKDAEDLEKYKVQFAKEVEKSLRKSFHLTPKKAGKAAKQPAKPAETPEQAAKPPPEVDDTGSEVDEKTSFKFYAGQVCKEFIARHEQYKTIRISTEIRVYLSDLIIEFIQRLAPLVNLITDNMRNRTINQHTIMKTIEVLMIDGHKAQETLEFVPVKVPDPAVLKAELTKRDEERKQGRKYIIDFDAIKKVDGYQLKRDVGFPTSGFTDLYKEVMAITAKPVKA